MTLSATAVFVGSILSGAIFDNTGGEPFSNTIFTMFGLFPLYFLLALIAYHIWKKEPSPLPRFLTLATQSLIAFAISTCALVVYYK